MEARPYLKEIQLRRDLIASFGEYPFNIPAVSGLSTLKFHPDVTFFVGENATGKSTLIEAIALGLGFSIEGGTKNVRLQTHDNSSHLYNYIKTIRSYRMPADNYFLRAESFYNVATYMEEVNYLKAYNDISLHARSHGESFMATLTLKLTGKGLYIFDEPEAALSPSRQLAALAAIHDLVKKQSQFIIATHSPILLAYPNAIIYQLDEGGIKQVKYEETEHYMITRQFLNNRSQMIKMICDE